MTAPLFRKAAGILVCSGMIIFNLDAQDRNEVITAFNESVKLVQTDAPAAIKAFEAVIVLADKAGESAADLKLKAQGALPGLYIKVASSAITDKKPVAEYMKAAKTAVAVSEKYGTPANKDNASKTLVRAYNTQASEYFTKNDLPNALVTFDSLLAINPDYINAIYNKALIYVKQNNSDAFELAIDSYLEKVKAANDTVKVKQASTLATGYFRGAGSKANQAEKLDDALALLNKAAKYGDDKDLFYYFADVYSKQKNFDKGMEYAQRGLDLETGLAEAKAKFWFQLGISQAGKGMIAEACTSFKNSLFGPFAEPSKIQMKNLKCQ